MAEHAEVIKMHRLAKRHGLWGAWLPGVVVLMTGAIPVDIPLSLHPTLCYTPAAREACLRLPCWSSVWVRGFVLLLLLLLHDAPL